jgi:hypothetical protein
MDPNVVQVEIIGRSLFSEIVMPLVSGIGGVVVGGLISWMTMKRGINLSHQVALQRQKDVEDAELQNFYHSLLIEVEGFWEICQTGRTEVEQLGDNEPLLAHWEVTPDLITYEANSHLIARIPDRDLQLAIIAAYHAIHVLALVHRQNNVLMEKLEQYSWRAEESSIDMEKYKGQQRTMVAHAKAIKASHRALHHNLQRLTKFLEKNIKPLSK